MNLKYKGINPKRNTVNKSLPVNKSTSNSRSSPDNNFIKIESVHDKIIKEKILKKAGSKGVGFAMASVMAGKQINGKSCGCGGR